MRDGILVCVAWVEKEILNQQKAVEYAKRERQSFGMYEDCGSFYDDEYTSAQARLATLVYVKSSLEDLITEQK